MSTLARTAATGGEGLLPELLAWSTSLGDDRVFLREDLLGSAAHATMLGRAGIVPLADARALRAALLALDAQAARGEADIPDGEEDVHMAVESLLGGLVGTAAQRLHTARSRNDQVATDLRLHVRDRARAIVLAATSLADACAARAEAEVEALLPAYTHRQRAQPISFGFQLVAWASGLLRATETMAFAMDRANELALGSGACSGSSLPIDRALVARLLGFPRATRNALDTVGDRDFALDFAWAGARVLLALGRMAADLVDLSTAEFATVRLDGAIATGSSMMPQKKNPDVFELLRAKSAHGVANVVELLVLVKGLPSGYNRDQQDDRRATLSTAPTVLAALRAMELSLPHVRLDAERGRAALADGSTQATDLAEAMVRKGIPFREAYKAVGALVRYAADAKVPLASVSAADAARIHPALDAEVLAVLEPSRAMHAKTSAGGTAPPRVREQIADVRSAAAALRARAESVPTLDVLAGRIAAEPL
jgi:argininosuccinate lyase